MLYNHNDEEAAPRRSAYRLMFARVFMFMLLVSFLTSQRRNDGMRGSPADTHSMADVPAWCALDQQQPTVHYRLAPTPIIYQVPLPTPRGYYPRHPFLRQGRQGWDRRHMELASSASARPSDVKARLV